MRSLPLIARLWVMMQVRLRIPLWMGLVGAEGPSCFTAVPVAFPFPWSSWAGMTQIFHPAMQSYLSKIFP